MVPRQSRVRAIISGVKGGEGRWYLPLPQLLLKLEHPLVIVVAVVKRCHAARHSEVKKSKDDRARRVGRRTIDLNASRDSDSHTGRFERRQSLAAPIIVTRAIFKHL